MPTPASLLCKNSREPGLWLKFLNFNLNFAKRESNRSQLLCITITCDYRMSGKLNVSIGWLASHGPNMSYSPSELQLWMSCYHSEEAGQCWASQKFNIQIQSLRLVTFSFFPTKAHSSLQESVEVFPLTYNRSFSKPHLGLPISKWGLAKLNSKMRMQFILHEQHLQCCFLPKWNIHCVGFILVYGWESMLQLIAQIIWTISPTQMCCIIGLPVGTREVEVFKIGQWELGTSCIFNIFFCLLQ